MVPRAMPPNREVDVPDLTSRDLPQSFHLHQLSEEAKRFRALDAAIKALELEVRSTSVPQCLLQPMQEEIPQATQS
jgi:hypothetical protein